MSNALETVEVTGVTTNKSSVIDQAIAQVAGAVNDESQINLAAANAVLIAADVFYNISLQVINATVVGRSITWPNKARYNLILWLDSSNTQSVNLIKGATTIALTPSTTYIIRSGPGANDIEARILASLGPVSPYVIKAGDIMTGPLIVPPGTVALPGMGIGEPDTGFYRGVTGHISMTIDGVEWGRFTGGSGLAIGAGFDNGANDLIDVRALLTGARVYVRSQVSAGFLAQRTSADASGPTNVLRKTRGTHAAIAAPSLNDTIGSVIWQFSTGGVAGAETGGGTVGSFTMKATAAVPSDTDSSGSFIWNVTTPATIVLAEIMRLNSNGLSIGNAAVENAVGTALHIKRTGGVAATFKSESENGSTVILQRSSANNGPASIDMYKSRGTIAAPTQALANDILFELTGRGYDNGGTPAVRQSVIARAEAVGNVTTTNSEGRWVFLVTPNASVTPGEIMRLAAASGWSMNGANPVINENRIHRMRSTTIAGAIAASFAGQQAYFSDAENSKGAMVRDDGSQYILVGQRGVQRLTSDADATFTPISSGSRVRDTSTLTAERKLTLASTNRSDGQECWYARTGTGNFARAVYQSDGSTLIKRMPPNSWAIFIYDSTAALWYLDKFGSLNTSGDVSQAAASDETTALTTGTGKLTFRAPYAMYVTEVRASLSTAQTSGTIFTVDINEAGSTILSTKLTIDNTEKTSTTANTLPVISDAFIADDAEITIDIDQIGDGTAKGLKVTLIGMRM